MKSKLSATTDSKKSKLVIVAIGAAEGGFEAMKALLKYLPHNTGLAYTYIQEKESDLVAQLSKHTEMKVLEAKEGLEVEPDQLYVLSSPKPLMITDGVFEPALVFPESPYA